MLQMQIIKKNNQLLTSNQIMKNTMCSYHLFGLARVRKTSHSNNNLAVIVTMTRQKLLRFSTATCSMTRILLYIPFSHFMYNIYANLFSYSKFNFNCCDNSLLLTFNNNNYYYYLLLESSIANKCKVYIYIYIYIYIFKPPATAKKSDPVARYTSM